MEVISVLDGTRNSLLDMDKPFCYLGIHCILFHILLVLWGNYLVSDSFFFPLFITCNFDEAKKILKYYLLPSWSEFCDRFVKKKF